MEKTLPLLRGRITLEDAMGEDENVIHRLSYPEKRAIFYLYLDRRRALIAEVISRHLISTKLLRLGELKEWIHGSFNACIPISINPPQPGLSNLVVIRFPLPYKVGEAHFPGNVEEKLRCEAATYVWLQQNCPDVPIPRLFGFGFPGTQSLHQLENQHIPTDIPRDLTYTPTDTYLADLLACHDQRMRHQPNVIHSPRDGEDQLAALTTMRALLPHFVDRRSRRGGPFAMALTDLHQSNIFVDDDWRVTRLIDLGWACVRPVEMALNPPWWLSNQSAGAGPSALGIDELGGGDQRAKQAERPVTERVGEFADVFEREEHRALYHRSDSESGERASLTRTLRDNWERGTFWYAQALDCPSALYAIFMFHIQPRFSDIETAELDEFSRFVVPYWGRVG
ncbi:hypothetical protein N658DRAFT_519900 [Parathielavia hyrcaniae]|uniref:Aminoglycoside phosphotransferase domain-containing protein n=1 Tax=Parathielavia hyrcaniae TaxID=113614 RepID=A0AAN6T6R0_9PEZI|nr:hypothetical protein N658DRAFT_519900 [Parathielavia hyrcaniae]